MSQSDPLKNICQRQIHHFALRKISNKPLSPLERGDVCNADRGVIYGDERISTGALKHDKRVALWQSL